MSTVELGNLPYFTNVSDDSGTYIFTVNTTVLFNASGASQNAFANFIEHDGWMTILSTSLSSVNQINIFKERIPGNEVVVFVITFTDNGITYKANVPWDAPAYIQGNPSLQTGFLPGAPTSLVGTSSNQQVQITFTPGSDGGSAITNYEYSLDNEITWIPINPPSNTSPITISGLTNNTGYKIKLRAVNDIGSGTASSTLYVTPLPFAGLQLLLDAANYEVGSTWYDYSGKSMHATLFNNPIWSSENGGRYEFNGVNQYGQLPSGFADFTSGLTIIAFVDFGTIQQNERILDFANGSPNNNIILARNQLTDTLSGSIFNGTSFTLTASLTNGIVTNEYGFYGFRANGTTARVFNQSAFNDTTTTVLPNNVTRTINYIGRSNFNLSDNKYFNRFMSVIAVFNTALTDAEITTFQNFYTSRSFVTFPPDAPTNVIATPGNRQASVSWTAPSNDGGLSITSYTITSNPGNFQSVVSAPTTTGIVTGLTNGVSYTFTVTATNNKTSIPSSPSSPVIPFTSTPDPPTSVVASVFDDTTIIVTWAAPIDSGQSSITSYTVLWNSGNNSITTNNNNTVALIPGLVVGVQYQFTVFATNSFGNSSVSSPSNVISLRISNIDLNTDWSLYIGNVIATSGSVNSITRDASNNVYVLGNTNSSGFNISGTNFNKNDTSMDGYVAKFNPSGVLQWGRLIGGSSIENAGTTIKTFGDQSVTIAGTTNTSGFTIIGTNILKTSTDTDVFLAQFNQEYGTPLWGHLIGVNATGVESTSGAITYDSEGNIYVVGSTTTSGFTLGYSQNFNASTTLTGIFSSANASGATIMSVGNGTGISGGFTTISGRLNHVRFAGPTSRTLRTNPLNLVHIENFSFWAIKGDGSNGGGAPTTNEDFFVEYSTDAGATFSSIGTVLFGGNNNGTAWTQYVVDLPPESQTINTILRFRSIASSSGYSIDNYGLDDVEIPANSRLVYNFSGVPVAKADNRETAFLCKYNVSGFFQWGRLLGMSGTTVTSGSFTSVKCDTSNNVWVAGVTSSSGLTSSGILFNKTGLDFSAILARYDSSGILQFGRTVGSGGANLSSNQKIITSIDVDSSGIFIGGYTNNACGFIIPNTNIDVRSASQTGFLCKVNNSGEAYWGSMHRQPGNTSTSGVSSIENVQNSKQITSTALATGRYVRVQRTSDTTYMAPELDSKSRSTDFVATARTSAEDNAWRSVVWSAELELFVAVGQTGSGNRVMTSNDGINWTIRTSAADNNWASIVWSPQLGLFVAVAYSGTGNRVMTSPDGINWTARTSAADNDWRGICWAAEIGLFVVVGTSGSENRVMTSPDGINWTIRTSAANNAWIGVCWSPELQLFVAVGESLVTNNIMTSPDGINWTTRTSNGTGLTSVCWSSELRLFVTVAFTGSGNRVMTSPDGITWTSRTSAANNIWINVIWSPELGIFVASAVSGTGNRIMTSSNGINWTIRTSAADNDWWGLTWSPQLGRFVFVALSGAGNRVMTIDSSPLLQNDYIWRSRASAADNDWFSVTWASELGIFVAVSRTGSGNRVMTSPDGINWTIRTSAANNDWRSVTWSPQLGMFVAVSASGTNTDIMTSYDGIIWTSRTPPEINQKTSVTWSPQLGIFVAVSQTGTSRVMTSSDGIIWTSRTAAVNNDWLSVCWSPELGIFVAVAWSGTGNRVMTSPDGINWTSRTSAANNGWHSVTWSAELHLFVAVAFQGGLTDRIMTSPDGINWTARNSVAPNEWISVIWSPQVGIFIAVARTGVGNRVMTSPDGINWTARTSATDNGWNSITWSPELRRFVAVAWSGTGNRVMTLDAFSNVIALNEIEVYGQNNSKFGAYNYNHVWTLQRSAANNEWISVTWSPELGIFVAVGQTGSGNRVMTSPDGINWTIQSSAADNNWRSVTWSSELGIFVAVASSGTGNRVMTSSNGINWTTRTSAADNNWWSVTWSSELGIFVAVSWSGTNNRVMTSSNGITWTSRTSAADNNWHGVTWSSELGIFVAVAGSGVGNRVMTSPDGINWTIQTSAADNDWRSVTWSPELDLFVVVARSGEGNRVMTSPDGIIWNIRTSAADNEWWNVTWSSELGIFVAVATTGIGNRIMTSPDGINWTTRTTANTASTNGETNVINITQANLFNLTSSCGANSFYSGTNANNRGFSWVDNTNGAISSILIQISVGVECSAQTRQVRLNGVSQGSITTVGHCQCNGSNNPIFSITANIENYNVGGTNTVIIDGSGTFGLFASSSIGTNYARITITQSPSSPAELYSVVWSPQVRRFVAVAGTGTGNRVMTSTANFLSAVSATNSTTLVSSEYKSTYLYNDYSFGPRNLIDGDRRNKITQFYFSANNYTTSGTQWVELDLGQNQDIYKLKLYNRTDEFKDTSEGLSVYIRNNSGEIVYTSSEISTSQDIYTFDDSTIYSEALYVTGYSSVSGFTVSGSGISQSNLRNVGFIASYDTITGTPDWGKIVGNAGTQVPLSVFAQDNNVLFGGITTPDGFDVPPADYHKFNNLNQGLLLEQETTSGIILNATLYDETSEAVSLTQDTFNSLYVFGFTTTSGFRVPGSSIVKSGATTDGFFTKYTSSRSAVLGGLIPTLITTNNNMSVRTDSSGFMYLAANTATSGYSVSGTSFGKNNTATEGFIAKMNPSGVIDWARMISQVRNTPADTGAGAPTTIPLSGLSAWYDADSFTTGQWLDKSVNARHSTSIQGAPVKSGDSVVFNGSSRVLIDVPLNTGGVTGWTIFIVGNVSGTNQNYMFFNSPTNYTPTFITGYTSNSIEVFGNMGPRYVLSNTFNSNRFIAAYRINANLTRQGYFNGQLAVSDSVTNPNGVQNFSVGGIGGSDLDPSLIGSVNDFIIYNRALSDAEVDEVHAYLQGKYPAESPQTYANAGPVNSMEIDENNNIVVAGRTRTSSSGVYVMKVNPSGFGEFVSVLGTPGQTGFFGTPISMKLDTSQNIIIGGQTTVNNLNISGISFGKTNTSSDLFLMKLNSSGIGQWGRLIGATASEISYSDYTLGVSPVDNSIHYMGTTSQSGFVLQTINLGKTNTSIDAFVAKFDTVSGVAIWANLIGGLGSNVARSLVVNSSGDCFVNGNTTTSGFQVIQQSLGTLLGRGRYVRVERTEFIGNISNVINLNEIETYDQNASKFNAISASASSVLDPSTSYSPSFLIDGIRTNSTGASGYFHGIEDYTGPGTQWCEIDLGIDQDIYAIAIYNRSDCCQERAQGLSVFIRNDAGEITYTSPQISTTQSTYLYGFETLETTNLLDKFNNTNERFEIKYTANGAVDYARLLYNTQANTTVHRSLESLVSSDNSKYYSLVTVSPSGFNHNLKYYGTQGFVQNFSFTSIEPITDLVPYDGDTSIRLEWTPPTITGGTPILLYEIDAYITAGNVFVSTTIVAHVIPTGSPTLSQTGIVTGLTNGINYTFRVRMKNTGNAYSTYVSALKTPTAITIAQAVVNFGVNVNAINDYFMHGPGKDLDYLTNLLDVRAAIKANANLTVGQRADAVASYIFTLRAKYASGGFIIPSTDTTSLQELKDTLTVASTSYDETYNVAVFLPNFNTTYGEFPMAIVNIEEPDVDQYYHFEVPDGYVIQLVTNTTAYVTLQFSYTNLRFTLLDKNDSIDAIGKTYRVNSAINVGTLTVQLYGIGSLIIGQGTGGGGGDPYMTTVHGVHYKLPVMEGFVRYYQGMVEGKLLTINARLRKINNAELFDSNIRGLLDHKSKAPEKELMDNLNSAFKDRDLNFFEKLYMEYDGNSMIVNIWDGKLRIEEYKGRIKMNACKEPHIMNKCTNVYKNVRSTADLKFTFGTKSVLYLSLYDWPLVRNAIYLVAPNMAAGNGVIVNALSKYSMTLPDIKSSRAVPKFDAVRFNEIEEYFLDEGGYRRKKVMVAC